MKSKQDMKQKLNYVSYIVKDGNELLKKVFEDSWNNLGPTRWTLQLKICMETARIDSTMHTAEESY